MRKKTLSISDVTKLLNLECNTNNKNKIELFLKHLGLKTKMIRGANHCKPVISITINNEIYCVTYRGSKNAGFKFKLLSLDEYKNLTKKSKLDTIFEPDNSGNYTNW